MIHLLSGEHHLTLDQESLIGSPRGGGGGDFNSKVIGMLVVFFRVQNSDFGIFRVFWKIFGKWKQFSPKQPSKLQFGYFLAV